MGHPETATVQSFQAWRALHWLRDPDSYRAEDSGARPETIAAVLACSDLPGSPEELLGLPGGSLYTIQCGALGVTSATRVGLSLALEQLRVPLVLVMGHDGCCLVDVFRALVASTKVDLPGALSAPDGAGSGWGMAQEVADRVGHLPEIQRRVRNHEVLVVPMSVSNCGAKIYWPQPAALRRALSR